jgi:DNA-binding PadR family transcriptional regulator
MRTERHHHDHHGRYGHRFAKLAMLKAAKFGAGSFGGWGGPFGGGFGGWDEDGEGRRGRRGGRMFGSGELRLVLLKLIADEPRHGYQLIKAVEELTQGTYAPSPGVVYPTLSLLADEGAVTESEGEGSRKAFAITEQGQAELAEKQAEVERIVARLAERGEGQRRGPPPQVARALGNLLTVLRQSKHAENSEERHNAIVDIIDEAAKRIERL